MKKTMSILIAALLLLTVVTGCSKPKAAAKKADSDTIKANGKLVVGITDFAPMDYMGDNGEWIGFDACLMSSVETAFMCAPYAEYMIASQEVEPGSGWNYAFLSGIGNMVICDRPNIGADLVKNTDVYSVGYAKKEIEKIINAR